MNELIRHITFELVPMENADRIAVAKIHDSEWQCVTAKQQWEGRPLEGFYVAIDTLVDPVHEEFSFLKDKADKKFSDGRPGHRIRTMKLRGKISQGLLIPIPEWARAYTMADGKIDMDQVASHLGLVRYEPQVPFWQSGVNGDVGDMIPAPSSFLRYNKAGNAKNYPSVFVVGEQIRVTEKIHGTNFRVALLRRDQNEEPEFFVGSHNTAKSVEGTSIYPRVAKSYGLEEKLRAAAKRYLFTENVIVYGEVYGHGIQDLHYGGKPNQPMLRLFDVVIDHVYQPWDIVQGFARELGVPVVDVLYRGPFDKNLVLSHRDGKSTLPGADVHVREGVVVTAEPEATFQDPDGSVNRKTLKYISDDYLLRKGEKDGH